MWGRYNLTRCIYIYIIYWRKPKYSRYAEKWHSSKVTRRKMHHLKMYSVKCGYPFSVSFPKRLYIYMYTYTNKKTYSWLNTQWGWSIFSHLGNFVGVDAGKYSKYTSFIWVSGIQINWMTCGAQKKSCGRWTADLDTVVVLTRLICRI